jgi:hypothetical protein
MSLREGIDNLNSGRKSPLENAPIDELFFLGTSILMKITCLMKGFPNPE